MDWHWQLPGSPLRARVLSLVAFGAIGAAGAAAAASARLNLGSSYPVKAAAIFGAVSLAAIGGLRTHHPHPSFGPANIVTTGRVWLLALIAATIGEPPGVRLAAYTSSLVFVAVLLDGVDGWLARRFGTSSPFGARYDMEVDALLVLVLSVLVWHSAKAGAWILLAGAMRYLFVLASYLWTWLAAPLPQSRRRQAICVVQIVGLGAVSSPLISGPAAVGIAAAALASLIYSFTADIVWLRRRHA